MYVTALGTLTLIVAMQSEAMLIECAGGRSAALDCQTNEAISLSGTPYVAAIAAPTRVAQRATHQAVTVPAAVPSGQPTTVELNGFRINPPAAASAPLAESAPFIVFFAILITVLMVRSKNFNGK